MKIVLTIFALSSMLVACSTSDIGPNALDAEARSQHALAASRPMCVFQSQTRCDHLVENREAFGKFFSPEGFGNIDENEKARGRRLATKFVVESLAETNQCVAPSGTSINIMRGMEIDRKLFDVKGTSPLIPQQSSCFITPSSEDS